MPAPALAAMHRPATGDYQHEGLAMNDNGGNIVAFAKAGAPKPPGEDVTFTITSYANGSLEWVQNGSASEMEIIGLLEIVKAAIISGEYEGD